MQQFRTIVLLVLFIYSLSPLHAQIKTQNSPFSTSETDKDSRKSKSTTEPFKHFGQHTLSSNGDTLTSGPKQILFGITSYGYGYPIQDPFSHRNLINGLMIKTEVWKINVRLLLEQINSDLERTQVECCDILYKNGFVNQSYVRLGLDKAVYKWKFFTPYAGVDVIGYSKQSDIHTYGGFVGVDYRENIRSRGFGVAPLVGLKLNITQRFALSYEARIQWIRQTENLTLYNDSYGSGKSTSSTEIVELPYFGPFIFAVEF